MKYDVIIVGAGPAGLSTALFLLHARPDLRDRILVLERKAFPREKFCAGAVGGRADRLLAEIGVRLDVPSVPLRGMRMTLPRGMAERAPGFIGRTVRRFEFDAELARQARDRGVTLLEESPVHEIHSSPEGLQVGTPHSTYGTSLLVGADGVGSFVRRWLDLPFGTLRARVVEVDTDPLPNDPPDHLLHFDVTDRCLHGYAWDFPTPLDGRVMMTRGVYSLASPGHGGSDVGTMLDRRLERLGLNPGDYRKKRMVERGFEPHHPFSRGRVLLVGEAAGVDPVTGEGIAQAIQYGALAGHYLAEKLRQREFSLFDWPVHFQRSVLGTDLFLRRWAAYFFFRLARRPSEVLFTRIPRTLDLTTALFAGTFPVRPSDPPWSPAVTVQGAHFAPRGTDTA